MKKLIALLLVLTALISLCACGGTSAAGSVPDAPVSAPEAPAAEASPAPSAEPAPEPTPEPTPEPQQFAVPSNEPFDWKALLDYPDPVPQERNPQQRMAHNIYSDPRIYSHCKGYSGFLIDFCADHDPAGTYWALCNWEMDLTDLKGKVRFVNDRGGAYAGLQSNFPNKQAIMSFWEIIYTDNDGKTGVIRAQRVYPEGDPTHAFGGEGEGTNYITDYKWEPGKWYRMYLTCYEDPATGHTFVEQWFQDIESGVWTKISCFDTGLSNSFFKGDMSQFMENYAFEKSNAVRSFAYRNIYVRDAESGEWIAAAGSVLSVDTWWDNKKGSFAFTADDCTLYGITCGYGEDTAVLNEEIREVFDLLPTEPPHTPEETQPAG